MVNGGIDRQLTRLLNSWPESLAREFRAYRAALCHARGRNLPQWGQSSSPYWYDLPEWIRRAEGARARAITPRAARDAGWGESCLMYAIRIQDDLLDGQLGRTSLAVAPALLHCEAARVFMSMIGNRPQFWRYYYRAVRGTIGGILRASALQRDPGAPEKDLLESYAEVDSIFTIGPAAIYMVGGNRTAHGNVRALVGEFGKAFQILDDMEDVEEDLSDGRFNYAARVLSRVCGRPAGPDLLRNMTPGDLNRGLAEIASTLGRIATRASRLNARIGSPVPEEVFESLRTPPAWKPGRVPGPKQHDFVCSSHHSSLSSRERVSHWRT